MAVANNVSHEEIGQASPSGKSDLPRPGSSKRGVPFGEEERHKRNLVHQRDHRRRHHRSHGGGNQRSRCAPGPDRRNEQRPAGAGVSDAGLLAPPFAARTISRPANWAYIVAAIMPTSIRQNRQPVRRVPSSGGSRLRFWVQRKGVNPLQRLRNPSARRPVGWRGRMNAAASGLQIQHSVDADAECKIWNARSGEGRFDIPRRERCRDQAPTSRHGTRPEERAPR